MANFTLDQTGQEIQDILDTVGNNQATQGQVLTADGTGGASWQNASGGKLYKHCIRNNMEYDTELSFIIIDDSSETKNTSAVAQWLYNNGFRSAQNVYNCSGSSISGSNTSKNLQCTILSGIYSSDGTSLGLHGRKFQLIFDTTAGTITTMSVTSNNFPESGLTDTVIEL